MAASERASSVELTPPVAPAPELSVVIPIYNEAPNLEPLYREFAAHVVDASGPAQDVATAIERELLRWSA